MASLSRFQNGAPGTYVNEVSNSEIQISIIPFNSAYMLVEVDNSVSINPSSGLPYNVPIQILSLEDYRARIGGSTPSAGPSLVAYNAIKGFFRNAGSAPFYVVRVKPAAGKRITLAQPMPEEVQNPDGTFSTVYTYKLELNGFPLGRVDYDELGNPTHVGVIVDPGTTISGAVERVVDEILQDGPISSFSYIRYEEGSNELELYPRQVGQPMEVIIQSELVLGDLLGGTVSEIKASDDPTAPYPIIAVKDYVYALDVAFDPSLHKPGFVLAPCGFAKFAPQDRQILGQALENLARREYFNWLGLVDAGPRDGRLIRAQYDLPQFRLTDEAYTADPDPTQNKPVFIFETQDFYEVDYTGVGLPKTTVTSYDIDLPVNFANISVPVAGVELQAGRVIASGGSLYGVLADFTPLSTPLDIGVLLGSETITGPLPVMVNNEPEVDAVPSTLVLPVDGVALADIDDLQFDVTMNGITRTVDITFEAGGPESLNAVMVAIAQELLAQFGSNPIGIALDGNGDIEVENPLGEDFANGNITLGGVATAATIANGSIATGYPFLFQGQVVNNEGALSWVKRSFQSTSTVFTGTQQRLNLDPDVPISYYELWIEHNLREGNIRRSVYIPGGLTTTSREVPWNLKSHADFLRDGLMYTSPAGYITYEFPYWVDFESFEVPASAFRAGLAIRVYRAQGFQTPPAGSSYPIAGVIRPNVEITRQHQEASNKLGLNAGRYLPDYGPVFWSASTVTRRQPGSLWKWFNTSVIRSVVINSFQGAFDQYVFNVIDSENDIFRRIRSAGEDIMYRLWRGGALYGNSPNEAYLVVCDETNNLDFDKEEGDIAVDVHYVPVSTAERITVSIRRRRIGSLGSSQSSFEVSLG